MARYTGPKSKIARRFKEAIFGPDKALEKRTILRECMVIQGEEVNNQSMPYN